MDEIKNETLEVAEVQEESYKSGSMQYIDSREVAEMVGKEHRKLLRDIRTYIDQIKKINEGQNPKSKIGLSDSEVKRKIAFSDFFIESSYSVEGQSRSYPCYLVTQKGCEFIAHKLTGEKGTVFTATYINRFHEMEDALEGQGYEKLVNAIFEGIEKRQQQFMEQQVEASRRQMEFNQTVMERLENLEKAKAGYRDNPYCSIGEGKVESRVKEIYGLTSKVAELCRSTHTKILHYM